jgi:hypothetical protein
MALVRHTHTAGSGLTPEQLAEFRPVNFSSMEERAQAMRERQAAELAAVSGK